MKKMPACAIALTSFLFLGAPPALAQENSRTAPVEQSAVQKRRIDGVSVATSPQLASLSMEQKTDILSDLDALISANPVHSMSLEEFQQIVEIQQWAIAQKQRIRFIDAISMRKKALTNQNTSLKNSKTNAAELAQLESKLNTLGEDAQLANVDMQNAMQKMQQSLQTLSNVSKSLHDTAMGVIRKIG